MPPKKGEGKFPKLEDFCSEGERGKERGKIEKDKNENFLGRRGKSWKVGGGEEEQVNKNRSGGRERCPKCCITIARFCICQLSWGKLGQRKTTFFGTCSTVEPRHRELQYKIANLFNICMYSRVSL